MALAQLLIGFQLPVDIQNPKNLFIDLVLLTGYLYFARTLYRLPITFGISIFLTSVGAAALFSETKKSNDKVKIGSFILGFLSFLDLDDMVNPKPVPPILPPVGFGEPTVEIKREKTYLEKAINIINWFFIIVTTPLLILINSLVLALTFGIWTEEKKLVTSPFSASLFLGVFDRLGVVIIAVFAIMPQFKTYVAIGGISGLLLIVFIFVLRGNFSAVIGDNIEKEEKEKEKKSSKTAENSRSTPMFVEIVNGEENPIEIKNSEINPMCVDVVKGIENPYLKPLPVKVVNEIIQVYSQHSIPVEVINVVTTQQEEE